MRAQRGDVVKKLTYKFVANVSKTGRYFDGGTSLHLLVRQGVSGPRKYWVFRYTHNGKRRDKSLGVFPSVFLTEARKRAISLKAGLNDGNAPKIESPVECFVPLKNVTFQAYALDWIELNKTQWTNQKHHNQWVSSLETYCFPLIGEKPVTDVDVDDLLQILGPIWNTKTESATRIRERIERILAAAIVRGVRLKRKTVACSVYCQQLPPSAYAEYTVGSPAALKHQRVKNGAVQQKQYTVSALKKQLNGLGLRC